VDGQPSATDWGSGFDGVTDFFVGKDGAMWYLRHSSGDLRRIRGSVSLSTEDIEPSVSLARPSPSPASGAVMFTGSLAATGSVRLALYDVRGREVRELLHMRAAAPGPFRIMWDGADAHGRRVPTGIYFARLVAGGVRLERRVLIIR
jgi:hypothetical protein